MNAHSHERLLGAPGDCASAYVMAVLQHELRVTQYALQRQSRRIEELEGALESMQGALRDDELAACCILSSSGKVQQLSAAARALLSQGRRTLVGTFFPCLVHFKDKPRLGRFLLACARSGETRHLECVLLGAFGSSRPVHITCSAIRQDSGRLIGFKLLLIDQGLGAALASHAHLLGNCSELLAASLDFRASIVAVLTQIVPKFARYAFVDLQGEDGRSERLHPDVVKLSREVSEQQLAQQIFPTNAASSPQTAVLRSGQHLLSATSAVSSANERFLMILPLRAGERVLGTLTLNFAPLCTNAQSNALRVGTELAHRMALAYDNGRRHDYAHRAVSLRETFMGMISHDLRGLLGVILLKARLLQGAEAAQIRRQGEGIANVSQRMARLLDDLLNMVSIHSGQFEMTAAPESADRLLHEAVDTGSEAAQQAAVLLTIEGLPAQATLLCDRGRLLQVLSNLIGNAIKFTPPGGRVQLRAQRRSGAIVFSVADSGPGIASDILPKIFDAFWQAPQTLGQARIGSGLGLFISRGIVSAAGGRIWAESTLGQGTTFFVSLPCEP